MPRMCCVPGCKGNYRSEGGPTVTTFKFPRDPNLKNKWIKAIRRDNFIPSSTSVVCIQHFKKELVVRFDSVVRDDGTVLTVARKVPKLMNDTVPDIFPNQQPSNPKAKLCFKQKVSSGCARVRVKQENDSYYEPMEANKIESFVSFKNIISRKDISKHGFHLFQQEQFVSFCKLNFSGCPKVTVSFKVFQDLSCEIWRDNIMLPADQFKWLLGQELKLDSWSKFSALSSHLSSFTSNSMTRNEKFTYAAKLIAQTMFEF